MRFVLLPVHIIAGTLGRAWRREPLRRNTATNLPRPLQLPPPHAHGSMLGNRTPEERERFRQRLRDCFGIGTHACENKAQ